MNDLFKNADEWERVDKPWLIPSGTDHIVAKVDGAEQWWVKKKPQESYAPSPEAKAVYERVERFVLYMQPIDTGTDTGWYEVLQAIDQALDAARQQGRDEGYAPWHAKCDEVGIPYDPDLLVRHHRANAALAATGDAMADRLERAKVEAEDTSAETERESVASPLRAAPKGED